MKIAIYARVSTSTHGQDPETQLIPLRTYIRNRGFETFSEYIDVASGVKEKRPSLDQLLIDAKQRKFDAVLVWKLDRLGRSLKHLITLIDEFQALGIQFISYTEGMDTTTPAGKLLFNVIGAIAGFERDLIKERVKAGLYRAKMDGRILGRPKHTIDSCLLVELRNLGLSIRAIAARLGSSPASISRFIAGSKPRELLSAQIRCGEGTLSDPLL
jgi:DNA invertase Pin-like site-specific DNA recombinase